MSTATTAPTAGGPAPSPRSSATPRALVRRPSPYLAAGLLTHLERRHVDVDVARQQWAGYVNALSAEGWQIAEVPAAEDCPDSVFVEDTAVTYADLAVITRPGAQARRHETIATEDTLRRLGYRIARIEEPGTLDGGDVLQHDGQVWVGLSSRTNHEGLDQLSALLEPLGATVRGVAVRRVLHLKSAVTALPDGTIIGYQPLVEDPRAWPRFLWVPEAAGAHVVLLGRNAVLMRRARERCSKSVGCAWSPSTSASSRSSKDA